MDNGSLPVWLTAEQASQYAGGINAKYIRKLWAMGKLRYSQPDLGTMVTKKEWIDEYLESCEVKPDKHLEERIDRALKEVIYGQNGS
jgi:hypothetical protein